MNLELLIPLLVTSFDDIPQTLLKKICEDLLPGPECTDIFKPCFDKSPGGNDLAFLGVLDEVESVRDVREVRQTVEVTCQVLALGQMHLVYVQ